MAKYDVATLEKRYRVSLPARVRAFIEGKEYAPYQQMKFPQVVQDGCEEYDRVVFAKPSLLDGSFFDKNQHPGRIPLAAFADERGSWLSQLVIVECAGAASGQLTIGWGASNPKDPPRETRALAPDLDAFLKLLVRRGK